MNQEQLMNRHRLLKERIAQRETRTSRADIEHFRGDCYYAETISNRYYAYEMAKIGLHNGSFFTFITMSSKPYPMPVDFNCAILTSELVLTLSHTYTQEITKTVNNK